ncbi:hypothetical protein B0T11DRAFT_311105 [Plectosphaerella cucumerina]|uniref:DUF1996 domain-containing protein n=1 Tax=Plectosphaerella cucumerina TaxID=40658 RepID=A0A8K0THG8_9PEZI|nr:hypothetical protein B0T11DRAFT_311105 [Plectosphaerella cucumerina]
MHTAAHALLAAAGLSSLASAFTNTEVKFFMRKNIDPIVVPGQYTSHMHSFFGSDSVNVNLSSTVDLQAGCSTARNPNDFSAYWIPTMYHVEGDKRTPIEPVSFFAYYGFDQDTPDIPIPENLSLLAGNADATSADDLVPGSDVTWLCQGQKFDAGGKAHSQFPQSTCSTSLQAVVFFPDCVDPNDLSRVAYSKPNGRVCPDGLSSMPQVRFSIRWDTRKAIPGGWSGEPPIELACGGSECFHGDFINGWLPEAGENMVKAIFNTREWQPVDGPNGKAKAGSICKRESRDVDPDNGTDDYEESLRMMEGGRGRVRAACRRARRRGTRR